MQTLKEVVAQIDKVRRGSPLTSVFHTLFDNRLLAEGALPGGNRVCVMYPADNEHIRDAAFMDIAALLDEALWTPISTSTNGCNYVRKFSSMTRNTNELVLCNEEGAREIEKQGGDAKGLIYVPYWDEESTAMVRYWRPDNFRFEFYSADTSEREGMTYVSLRYDVGEIHDHVN